MIRNCIQCGKEIDREEMAFCPYCGGKLPEPKPVPEAPRHEKAEQWIRKAMKESSFPKRKEILEKGLKELPDSRDIAWELLFIGEEGPKRGNTIDFSVIKCWIMEIYRKPAELPEDKKDRMRSQLFDSPELKRCLNMFEDPEAKHREYLQRLCGEYIELFMEGDNLLMGNWFGFHRDRKKEKVLAEPAAAMIQRMRQDEKLLPEQRNMLGDAMYKAFSLRYNGKTEYLDSCLRG